MSTVLGKGRLARSWLDCCGIGKRPTYLFVMLAPGHPSGTRHYVLHSSSLAMFGLAFALFLFTNANPSKFSFGDLPGVLANPSLAEQSSRSAVFSPTTSESAIQQCASNADCCTVAVTKEVNRSLVVATASAKSFSMTPDDSNNVCNLFCSLGSNIAAENGVDDLRVSGLGLCKPKWSGFCTEDEDCGHTVGTAAIFCRRDPGSLAGTCQVDAACHGVSCGSGSCISGRCRCRYGFVGERCERSTAAFAFLLYGDNLGTLVSARVFVRSLRVAGWRNDVLAIVPTGHNLSTTPSRFLDVLQTDGVKVCLTEDTVTPSFANTNPVIRNRWLEIMNKLLVWRMTDYSKVALVDVDMVFDRHSDHPSVIFEECQSGLCVTKAEGAPVIVATPSLHRYEHLVDSLRETRQDHTMRSRSFLTRYCEMESNRIALTQLDRKWDACDFGTMRHHLGWGASGYNVFRSCWTDVKLHNVRICSKGKCNENEEHHAVLVWQHHHALVDPCILHQGLEACNGQQSECMWCDHYCADRRLACSSALFKQSPISVPSETSFQRTVEGCMRNEVVHKSSGGSWEEVPSGWWAWPRGAFYEVPLDSFAVPSNTTLSPPCTDGGTFSDLRRKLGYLKRMGVDGIVLSFVANNIPGEYHCKWPSNLCKVNATLSSQLMLKTFVLDAHKLGVKVFAALNLNDPSGPGCHSPGLTPFNQAGHFHSANCSLFSPRDLQEDQPSLEKSCSFRLPEHNYEHPGVWHGLTRWVRDHVETHGFDGIRIDAAKSIPKGFLRHLQYSGSVPPIPAYYDIVSSSMSSITPYAFGEFDALYNYPLHFALKKAFVPGPKRQPMSSLLSLSGAAVSNGRVLLNFLDNNNMPRFFDLVGGDVDLYRSALLYILGTEGVPVLSYGSEQNLPGIGSSADPILEEPPHQWRPPLREVGYDTRGATFAMIRKVLWLRKRYHGLHHFHQRVIHADREAVAFARGPFVFVSTNIGSSEAMVQMHRKRLLLDIATEGCLPVRHCDLLATDIRGTCQIVEHGWPMPLELITGEPKLFVPESLLDDLPPDLLESTFLETDLATNDSGTSIPVLSPNASDEMPEPPLMSLSFAARMPRSVLPFGVKITDQPAWVPLDGFNIPSHLNRWYPPLGAPVDFTQTMVSKDTCYYTDRNQTEAIVALRSGKPYFLCPFGECGGVDQTTLGFLEKLPEISNGVVLHLTWGRLFVGGFYHVVVQYLPSVVTVLTLLRSGMMRLYLEDDAELAYPIFDRLDVPRSAIITPLNRKESFSFCTAELRVSHVDDHPSIATLQAFRSELDLPDGPRPFGAARRSIVVLSRGNSSRRISNENKLIISLQALGRPVEVALPEHDKLPDVITLLSRAEVIVGVHGANLVNMIYAPAGTKVLEILPQVPFNPVNYHYWALAGSLRFPYHPYGQRTESFDKELGANWMTQSVAIKSFPVDVDAVVIEVAKLLSDGVV